jgi:hypothetical protein
MYKMSGRSLAVFFVFVIAPQSKDSRSCDCPPRFDLNIETVMLPSHFAFRVYESEISCT